MKIELYISNYNKPIVIEYDRRFKSVKKIKDNIKNKGIYVLVNDKSTYIHPDDIINIKLIIRKEEVKEKLKKVIEILNE